jgi:hypothetical protein
VPIESRDPSDSQLSTTTIAEAIRLRDAHPTRRAVAEAHLLAGEGDAAIAAALEVTAEVVSVFESLFFCVRDRLTASDWIALRAIGLPGSAPDPIALLKRYAYLAGPAVLAAVTPYLIGVGTRSADPALDASIRRCITLDLLPDNVETNYRIMLGYASLMRAGKPAAMEKYLEALSARSRKVRTEGGRGGKTEPAGATIPAHAHQLVDEVAAGGTVRHAQTEIETQAKPGGAAPIPTPGRAVVGTQSRRRAG